MSKDLMKQNSGKFPRDSLWRSGLWCWTSVRDETNFREAGTKHHACSGTSKFWRAVCYPSGMMNQGDNVKTEFRKVETLKGNTSSYHTYTGEIRTGRVGKLTDGSWQAYTVRGKKVGDPTKTRKAAVEALLAVPSSESGLRGEESAIREQASAILALRDPIPAPENPDEEEEEEIEEDDVPPTNDAEFVEHRSTFPNYPEANTPETREPPVPPAPASSSSSTAPRPPLRARVKAWFRNA